MTEGKRVIAGGCLRLSAEKKRRNSAAVGPRLESLKERREGWEARREETHASPVGREKR